MTSFSDLFSFWAGPFGTHFYSAILFPCVASIFIVMWRRADFKASLVRTIEWCAMGNILFVAGQLYCGVEEGIHLAPFFWIVIAVLVYQKKALNPLVAYAATWLSIFAVDVASGYAHMLLEPRFRLDWLLPLEWLGGDGFKDGLFVFPLISLALAALVLLPDYIRSRMPSPVK